LAAAQTRIRTIRRMSYKSGPLLFARHPKPLKKPLKTGERIAVRCYLNPQLPVVELGAPPQGGRDTRGSFYIGAVVVIRTVKMQKLWLAKELWLLLGQNKKWWLLSIVITMLLVGGLLVFAQTSALGPFIYTIF
jgi:hypothetical protein